MPPPPALLRMLARREVRRHERAHRRPEATRARVLRRIVERYRDTELGYRLGLQRVRSPEDFARLVPVTTADTYGDLWRQASEANPPGLVHPQPLRYMALSSGTSGVDRSVPFPAEHLASFRRFSSASVFHAMVALDDYGLFGGKALVTASPVLPDTTPGGVVTAYGTGIAALNAPRMARSIMRPTFDLLQIADWAERLDATFEQVWDADVRVLTGVPNFVVPLLERLREFAAARGRPIRCAKDLWPNLRLYGWSGSPIAVYARRLRELIGEDVTWWENYSATEGPVAFQHRPGARGLTVDLLDSYVELQPAGGDLDGPRLGVHEAHVGGTYRVLVTSWAGLFAYHLGDLVEVVGAAPFRVVFAGREAEELRLGIEHLGVRQAREALEAACRQSGTTLEQFCVCPAAGDEEGHVGHEWLVDLSARPRHEAGFAAALDEALRELNGRYAASRATKALEAPRVTVLRPGTIARWHLRHREFGQGKFVNLHRDRVVAEQLAQLSDEASG